MHVTKMTHIALGATTYGSASRASVEFIKQMNAQDYYPCTSGYVTKHFTKSATWQNARGLLVYRHQKIYSSSAQMANSRKSWVYQVLVHHSSHPRSAAMATIFGCYVYDIKIRPWKTGPDNTATVLCQNYPCNSAMIITQRTRCGWQLQLELDPVKPQL